jgi:hypothetical protein
LRLLCRLRGERGRRHWRRIRIRLILMLRVGMLLSVGLVRLLWVWADLVWLAGG